MKKLHKKIIAGAMGCALAFGGIAGNMSLAHANSSVSEQQREEQLIQKAFDRGIMEVQNNGRGKIKVFKYGENLEKILKDYDIEDLKGYNNVDEFMNDVENGRIRRGPWWAIRIGDEKNSNLYIVRFK